MWNDPPGGFHPVSAPDFLPREQLQAIQLQRLKSVVGRAFDHVALFRSRMDERGITPAHIGELGDIAKLPEIVAAWNQRYAFPKIIFCRYAEFFEYIEKNHGDKLPVFRGSGGTYWKRRPQRPACAIRTEWHGAGDRADVPRRGSRCARRRRSAPASPATRAEAFAIDQPIIPWPTLMRCCRASIILPASPVPARRLAHSLVSSNVNKPT